MAKVLINLKKCIIYTALLHLSKHHLPATPCQSDSLELFQTNIIVTQRITQHYKEMKPIWGGSMSKFMFFSINLTATMQKKQYLCTLIHAYIL